MWAAAELAERVAEVLLAQATQMVVPLM